MGGRLYDWLSSGVAASRPAAVDIPPLLAGSGSVAFYFATDTKILSVFDDSGPSWFDIDVAALAAVAFATLPDVDLTGIADEDSFKWDAVNSQVIPVTLLFNTLEQLQDAVGAMIQNGSGMNVSYDDPTGKFVFDCTITQYTDELAQDAIDAAFAAGTHTGITIAYDDALNKYTLTVDGAWVDARADARIAAASIDDLADVDTTTTPPIDGDSLVWDTDHWEPQAGGGGASAIDDLSDVDTTTDPPTERQGLYWDDTNNKWVPGQPNDTDAATFRSFAAQSFASAASYNVTLPAGAQANDDLVIAWATGFTPNAPSGSFRYDRQTGTNWGGCFFKKRLTAGDITNGFITVTETGGAFAAVAVSICFVGACKVLDFKVWWHTTGATLQQGATPRVRPPEKVISFILSRGTATDTITGFSGTNQATTTASNGSGVVYSYAPSDTEILETDFNVSVGPTGIYYGHIIVGK